MFRQELKNNVKNKIMQDERDYKNLVESIEIVIDFNDKLYERVMKKRYDQFKNRAELIYKSVTKYAKSMQQLYIRNSKYTKLASIKLNITYRRKEKNFRDKKKAKKRNYVTNVKREIIL